MLVVVGFGTSLRRLRSVWASLPRSTSLITLLLLIPLLGDKKDRDGHLASTRQPINRKKKWRQERSVQGTLREREFFGVSSVLNRTIIMGMIYPDYLEIKSSEGIIGKVNHNMECNTTLKCNQQVKMLPSQHVFSVCQCSSEPNGNILSPMELDTKEPCVLNQHDHFIRLRMTHLADAFSARAQLFMSKLQRPPTPTQSSTSSFNSSNAVSMQSTMTKAKTIQSPQPIESSTCTHCISCTKVLDPQSRAYLCWLVAVSLCFAYNCWAIPLRISFPKHTLTVWDSSLPKESAQGVSHISHLHIPVYERSNSHTQNFNRETGLHSNNFKFSDKTVSDKKLPLITSAPTYQEKKNFNEPVTYHSMEYLRSTSLLFNADKSSKSSVEEENPIDRENHTVILKTSLPSSLTQSVMFKPEISTISYNHLYEKNAENSSKSYFPNLLTPTWLTLDVLADIIYLLDVLIIQPRVSFLSESGIWAHEITTTFQSYSKRKRSKLDIIALLPLDTIFYFVNNGKDHAYLRIPRLLKAGTFREMCERLDVSLASPHAVRIARTLASMLYLVHLHACAYYLFSTWEGIASNGWVFSGRGNAYIRCFYFATKTATSIGKNPKPVNEAEYMFMTWSWLSGVFVFALLIGQIRDIVATASKSRSEFQRLLDETIHYMRRIHLPEDTQRRVTQWLTHTWDYQQVLDEQEVLEWLPSKLRGDVALDVHEGSLSKVHLFRHCGQQLLRQLVLKLRPVLYLPGDYICRKGEVGKEMYIIKAGIVEVVGSRKSNRDGGKRVNDEVLATLTEGSVFGEISLLDIGGGNRRTADVRSKGFSTLFVLSKADLKEALEHHPEAKQILKEKASQLMRENADRERKIKKEEHKEDDVVIIKQDSRKHPMPKLIDTVIQAVGTKSRTAQLLMYGSRAMNFEVEKSKIANGETHVIEDGENAKMDIEEITEMGKHAVKPEDNGKDQAEEFKNSTYLQSPSQSTNNDLPLVHIENTDHVSLVSNGKHKYRSKKFGTQNVFECDVTVHQRMG